MSISRNIQKLIDISNLYYKNGYSKSDIAKLVGVSRQSVANYLQEALNEGIVEIIIHDPFQRNSFLAKKMMETTGLKRVVVIPSQSKDSSSLKRNIALASVELIDEIINYDDKVGISWGGTVKELAENYNGSPKKDAILIPLMGGFGRTEPSQQVNIIVQSLSEKMSSSCLQLNAPLLVNSHDSLEAFLKNKEIEMIINNWENIDSAIIGIGDNIFLTNKNPLVFDSFSYKYRKLLLKKQAVGDICWRFFNYNGEEIWNSEIPLNVISIKLEQLRKIKNKICLAGGKDKAYAIFGAIQGGFIDYLVTDDETANEIIKLYSYSELKKQKIISNAIQSQEGID